MTPKQLSFSRSADPLGSVSPRQVETLIRALSHVERVPLLVFLTRPRSLNELRREFPAISPPELNRTLGHLERAGWLTPRLDEEAPAGLSMVALRLAEREILALVPGARPASGFDPVHFAREVLVFRRPVIRHVLRLLSEGVTEHRALVMTSGAQSGMVSDALQRLELAGLARDRRVVERPGLHLLHLTRQLQNGQSSAEKVPAANPDL